MEKKKKPSEIGNGKFSAEPSKYFFIDMLTRDIPLEWAILDLIDNSVDGARNEIITKKKDFRNHGAYNGFYIHLTLNEEEFSIEDNCGGFTKKAAMEYTFKFGRPKGENEFPKGSVGRFGVGMKRGMFKIGTYFIVETKNAKDHFIVEEDIIKWSAQKGKWEFDFTDVKHGAKYGKHKPLLKRDGTVIKVLQLREMVKQDFENQHFKKKLIDEIQRTLNYGIKNGLEIKVNKINLVANPIKILTSKELVPYYLEERIGDVTIKIYAGIGDPDPNEAGWYIFCNDRLMVEKDKTNLTGWEGIGLEKLGGDIGVQKFHNKVAMFRGLVFFSADKSSSLPMTTTKIGVDINSSIYKTTRNKMINAMKKVISFLNTLENDEQRQEIVKKSNMVDIVTFDHKKLSPVFIFPQVKKKKANSDMTKVSYQVKKKIFSAVKKEMQASTNEQVGIETFDYYVKMKEIQQ